jgi:copper chaperone
MGTRFAVPDIHCEHCKTSIEGALAPLRGVEAVEVDVPGRVVTVEHGPGVEADELAARIEEQGYEVAAREALG